MRNLFFHLLILMTSITLSCSSESFDESTLEGGENTTIGETDPDTPDNTATTPCDFDLSNLVAGETKTIDCVLDLKGKNVTLPVGVILAFDKGDIINGTLNFAEGGKIAGELLNSKLDIEGDAKLIDPTFNFFAVRWDIVEGVITDDVAKKNKEIFQSLIYKIKELKGTTFSIDKFDAFFKVDELLEIATPRTAAINIPGDFNLLMTDNTHWRMQPNAYHIPLLVTVTDGNSNVLIKGGTFHGERDEHDYSDGGTHEWPTLLSLASCNNVVVDGVTFMDATGDGMAINATSHAHNPNYDPSRDILVTNCKFIRNRRNNLSITDGHDITIEKNEFIDAGIHTGASQGVPPGFAIDVEAARGTGPKPNQIAEDIIIRENIETGSRVGGFTVHTGDRVTIEGNQMENGVSYSTSIGNIIRNNTFTAKTNLQINKGTAISAGRNDRYEQNYGTRIYGNKITGYSTGILMSNTDLEVYDNNLVDCKSALAIAILTNSKINNNTITSTRESSDGIVAGSQSKYMDKGPISGNSINVPRTPIILVSINDDPGEENYTLTLDGNVSVNGGLTFNSICGFTFTNNDISNGGVRIIALQKSTLSNNKITPTSAHGIRIDAECRDLTISTNQISVSGNFDCINQTTSDGVNITISNDNTCIKN